MFLQLSSKKENILACERKMDLFLTGVFRRVLAALLLCSIIQKSESFRISRSPSNPKIVVLGVNSDRVELEWRYSDAPSSYLVNLFRQKPDESPVQLAVSKDGNAFKPGSTREFEANLDAILTLKNVKRDEEYSYVIQLTDLSDGVVKDQNKVVIKVVVPPEITDPPETAPLLTIGENHTLTCNASGDPLPNITWTKDGIPAEEFNVTGYKLHLTDVKLKDVGSYRCKASNGYGDDATSVSIASIRCDDCEIKTVGITLQSESWKSALNNQQSVEFKTLKANVLSEITKVYAKNPGKEMFGVGLVAFRSGSVVAEAEMKFGKSVTDPLKPLEDEIKNGKLGAFTVNRKLDLSPTFLSTNATATAFPSTNATATALLFTNVTSTPIPLTKSTASGTDQSGDRERHQNMLHAIYLTILFLLVVIIIVLVFIIWRGRNKQGALKQTGKVKSHREDQTDIRGQESPPELQVIGCTNIQGELLLTNRQSLKLQPQSSGNEG